LIWQGTTGRDIQWKLIDQPAKAVSKITQATPRKTQPEVSSQAKEQRSQTVSIPAKISGQPASRKTITRLADKPAEKKNVVLTPKSHAEANEAKLPKKADTETVDIQQMVESAAIAEVETPTNTRMFKAINGWIPQPGGRLTSMETIRVETKDNSCGFHYKVSQENQGLVYLETNVDCKNGWIHGKGEIEIVRVDGKKIRKYEGNFSEGFYTRDEIVDLDKVVAVKENETDQWGRKTVPVMYLLMGELPEQDGYFIGVMESSGNKWQFCRNAHVRLVEDNPEWFLDADMIDHLIKTAGRFYMEHCASDGHIQIDFSAGSKLESSARRDHEKSDYIINMTHYRHEKAWRYDKSRAWNGVIARRLAKVKEMERLKRQAERKAEQEKREQENEHRYAWQHAQSDYNRLKDKKGMDILLYQNDVAAPQFPLDLYARSIVRKQPVEAVVLLQVSNVDEDYHEVDWPVKMRLKDEQHEIEDEGVYLVSGTVDGGEPQSDELPLVHMTVEQAWRCEEKYCAEHADVLAAVKQKNNLPDFDPSLSSAPALSN